MNIKSLIVFLFILVLFITGGLSTQAESPLSTKGFTDYLRKELSSVYGVPADDVSLEWKDEDLGKKLSVIKKLYPGKNISLKVRDSLLKSLSGKSGLPIDVYVDEEANRIIYVKCSISVVKDTFVALRNIEKEEELSEKNTGYAKIPVEKITVSNNVILGFDDIKGKVAVSAIKEKSLITTQLIKQKVIVFKGNQVTIRIINGGLTLIGVGLALQDGSVGQYVSVKITGSSTQKVVVAKVLSNDLVEVDLGIDDDKK